MKATAYYNTKLLGNNYPLGIKKMKINGEKFGR